MNYLAELKNVFDFIRKQMTKRNHAYLVGGVVRDILLEKAPSDVDIVLIKQARHISQQLANAFGGDFYALDADRQTYRVIMHSEEAADLVLDIAGVRGETIEADLAERDFTINAIGLEITSMGEPVWVDPLMGKKDLTEGIIRACSQNSLQNDPVRVLRAIRFASQFGFEIEEETQKAMSVAVGGLSSVSGERIRDEFFKSLGKSITEKCLKLYPDFGLVSILFPGFSINRMDWENCLQWIAGINNIETVLKSEQTEDAGLDRLIQTFGREIQAYLSKMLTADRSILALLDLAILLHCEFRAVFGDVLKDSDDFATIQQFLSGRTKELVLSNHEMDFLVKMFASWHWVQEAESDPETLSAVSIYRFFKATSNAGIGVCLISLAGVQQTRGDDFDSSLVVISQLCDAYWNHSDKFISPHLFLDGHDLIREFQLQPGPKFKVFLEALAEAQVSGLVKNRGEAERFVGRLVETCGGDC